MASSPTRSRIRRHRRWLLLGVLVAGLVTASNFGTLRLLPPSFHPRSPGHATATTSVLVGLSQAAQQSQTSEYPEQLATVSETLGDIGGSPLLQRKIASLAGIPASELAIDEPLWADLQRAQQWDTGPKRASQIVVENALYRIQLTDGEGSPIINVGTQAPTPQGAARLASAFTAAVSRFVISSQNAAHTPASDRYTVTQSAPITVQPGRSAQLINFAIFLFLAAFALWFVAVMAISRLFEDLRENANDVKDGGRQRRSVVVRMGSSRRKRPAIRQPRTNGL